MRRATIAAEAPIIHPQMLRGAWPKVRGKTQRLTMPPAARERLLLWRPPPGPPHLRHRGCEVARPCAVHQRHAEARGGDVVLQVGIKPHGPASLESFGARVKPVGLAQGGAAGRCRQRQGQNWQQQGTACAHGGTRRGLGLSEDGSVGTAPGATQGRFRGGFGAIARVAAPHGSCMCRSVVAAAAASICRPMDAGSSRHMPFVSGGSCQWGSRRSSPESTARK